ncbi:hypothetical protein OIU76_024252 [Salix suchowensis]|nr:hypothetical protein OIU76_024252 [Salix suchowensis]
MLLLRNRLFTLSSLPSLPSTRQKPFSTSKPPPLSDVARFIRTVLFVPPGVDPEEVTEEMVMPGSNIVAGPYAGHSQIKEVEFVKSSGKAKDCPRDDRPEFVILGRSNVGKSSLINVLARKKEVALTSKKPGKTQLINHFLVNKSWYLVDLPGYGFAKAPDSARMDCVPPQKIDLDCANWLGRNNIPMTLVFTKCDKMKGKRTRPDENIKNFQELMRQNYREHPAWIMTSSVTGLGRDELLLHMSQLRNYWDQ